MAQPIRSQPDMPEAPTTTDDLEELLTPALPELATEDIVLEAEQMLREAAPHDFDILIIGFGAGGCSAAERALELGAHVGVVDSSDGELRIPMAALAHFANALRRPHDPHASRPDLRTLHQLVADQSSFQRRRIKSELEEAGVEIIVGAAKFVDQHVVEVACSTGLRTVRAVHIIIATGAKALRTISGATRARVCSVDELLRQIEIPPRLALIGDNVVALETACLYASLGAQVTLLRSRRELLPGLDGEVRVEWSRRLRDEAHALSIVQDIEIEAAREADGCMRISYRSGPTAHTLNVDLLAVSHYQPNTGDLGLEAVGITTLEGYILVDPNLQTLVSGVFAIGDCVHPDGRISVAVAEGAAAVETALGASDSLAVAGVPRCFYSMPSIALGGYFEAGAESINITSGSARWAATFQDETFLRVWVETETAVLAGYQAVGPDAEAVANLASIAIRHRLPAADLRRGAWAGPGVCEALVQAIRNATEERS